MQPIFNASVSSFFLTLTLLFGWLISDFRINDAVSAVAVRTVENASLVKVNVEMYPSNSTPNIDTNWFSGSNSGVSSQLPSAQARKDDEDDQIAYGGAMGESYGTGDDL
jgi:hypothetical protein